MSYRCECCAQVCCHQMIRHLIMRDVCEVVTETVQEPNGSRRTRVKTDHAGRAVRHTIHQIAREVSVCHGCKVELSHGVTLAQIQLRFEAAHVVQSGNGVRSEDEIGSAPAASPPGKKVAAPAPGLTGGTAQLKRAPGIAELFDS